MITAKLKLLQLAKLVADFVPVRYISMASAFGIDIENEIANNILAMHDIAAATLLNKLKGVLK